MHLKLRITSFLLFLAFPTASFAGSSPGCPNSYIERSPTNSMESEVYLIQVPTDFSLSGVDIIATYKSISSQRKPTHECIFKDSYVYWYREGVCKNLKSGRVTSIWGGSGYSIGKDGNTRISEGCTNYRSGCAYIEDSKGTRLTIDSDIAHNLYNINVNNDAHGRILRNCNSGFIEAITLMEAFPGFVLLQRSRETGFVNTYKSAPSIEF